MTVPAFELVDVVKRFGALTVLGGVSMEISSPEFVLLTGPNGSGKSTLLRLLAGLSQPTEGTVFIHGSEPKTVGNAVGLLSHQSLLYDDLSARENLDFFARLYGKSQQHVDSLVVRGGVEPFQYRLVHQLSSGMKKRIAFLRSIIQDPPLLLLDEPFDGLDRKGIDAFLSQLGRMKHHTRTVVIVAHRFDELADLVTHVVLLREGKIALHTPWQGNAQQLRSICA